MEASILMRNGSAIVPASHSAFREIEKLAKDQPLNQPFFIKDGLVAEIRAESREGGMIDDKYAILDGDRHLMEAWIKKWSGAH